VTAILGAQIAIASILFGVLGFLYSVFATFARRTIPPGADETKIDLRTHPVLPHLRSIAEWILGGLVLSLLGTIISLVWLASPKPAFDVLLALILVGEILLITFMGFHVTVILMYIPPSSRVK